MFTQEQNLKDCPIEHLLGSYALDDRIWPLMSALRLKADECKNAIASLQKYIDQNKYAEDAETVDMLRFHQNTQDWWKRDLERVKSMHNDLAYKLGNSTRIK